MLILLIFCSWTASYAQIGSHHVKWHDGRTFTCYDSDELRKIADFMIDANEQAELYKIAEQQLAFKDSIIHAINKAIDSKDSVIVSRESVISLKEEIIAGKDREITDLRVAIKKTNRKLKWTKLKWAGTTIGLSATLIYVILK